MTAEYFMVQIDFFWKEISHEPVISESLALVIKLVNPSKTPTIACNTHRLVAVRLDRFKPPVCLENSG